MRNVPNCSIVLLSNEIEFENLKKENGYVKIVFNHNSIKSMDIIDDGCETARHFSLVYSLIKPLEKSSILQ